jgi:hypothetical protein
VEVQVQDFFFLPPKRRPRTGWVSISSFVSIFFFSRNRSGFRKYGFENEIGICGYTETDKYGWRAGKLN